MKERLLNFLRAQRFLVVASHNKDTWISNVFYGIDDDFKIYFVSDPEAKHSKQILANPNIAFSTVWFNESNHEDRKGIQGQGLCRIASGDEEIKKGVELHNKLFPEFRERITFDYIKAEESTVWVIEPKYIKYWDDELYGDKHLEEFKF
jgi:uncharacterized protein YhbP (UPF0306 family)